MLSIAHACGSWRIRQWDEGAVAYNLRDGRTHALDLLSAELLRIGCNAPAGSMRDLPTLAALVASELEVPNDQALQTAVAQSLQRLAELDRE